VSETFHLGDLLSVTTGTLLAPTKMRGVEALLQHLTGVKLDVHQLLIAADVCAPLMIQDRPWLEGLKPPEGADRQDLVSWMSWAVSLHGEWHEMDSYPPNVWGEHDSFTELLQLLRRAKPNPFASLPGEIQRATDSANAFADALNRADEGPDLQT
jgi:hypothetical protein